VQKTATFFMFVGEQCGRAEEAVKFYTSVFDHSAIQQIVYYGPGEMGGKEGMVKRALFTLGGQEYMASENTFPHPFGFTPAVSVFVNCDTEAELDARFQKFAEGGTVLMPPGSYGFSRKFGWVSDRFGVSWQLNLA